MRPRTPLAAVLAASALFLLPLAPVGADPGTPDASSDEIVSAVDFEDGTTGSWTQSGGPVLAVVLDPADGTGLVLSVTGRANGWDTLQSPTELFEQGRTYTLSARVYLPGAAGQARFVVKDGYQWVANTAVPADTWTSITGSFTADASATQLYLEVDPAGADFYLDDILITAEPSEPPTGPVIPEGHELVLWQDFADGELGDGLAASGGSAGTLTFEDGVLVVNDRSADYVGIQTVPGLLEPGVEYTARVSIRLADGTGATQARWVGVPGYTWIGNTAVNDTEWTSVSGTWVAPDDPSARLYIGTADIAGTDAYTYLVDDVLITRAAQDGGEPQEPGAVLIDATFDDGELGDWSARQGSGSSNPTVSVVPGGADGTAYAAQVSDRTHEGDGIQIDVTDLLLAGRTYHLEAFVRFAPDADVGRGLTVSMRTVAGGSVSYANLIQAEDATATGWTRVSGDFTVPSYDTNAELYVEARYNSGNTSTFLVDQVRVSVPEPAVVDASLTPLKDTVDFPVGFAIDSRETAGAAATLLLHHADQITAENHMKVEAWYDADGTFARNGQATELLDFAQANGLRVYGHVLLWHSQTPAWFFQDDDGRELTSSEADRQILRDRLTTHIENVAASIAADYGPFGSATNPVVGWDVVNEVVSDQATADGLRTSRWYQILGEEYIHLAFEVADVAFNGTYAAAGSDRPVALFINDYNTEQDLKGSQYEALVRRLLDAGVPIDGVGHQFHLAVTTSIGSLRAALDRFEGLGLVQAVTELDVTINPPSEANLIRQGYFYRDLFDVLREYQARAPEQERLYSVTVWGLTDNRSWRSAQLPVLFDGGLQAKPAYYGAAGRDEDIPALLNTADVFGGDVELADGWLDAPEWDNLPENQLTGGAGGFQARWNADHLSVLVRTVGTPQALELEYQGEVHTYRPGDGTDGDLEGVDAAVGNEHLTLVHLPHSVSLGDSVDFDLRVLGADGGVEGWNSPGASGRLTLLEPLSYLEVPELSAPQVDGQIDEVWADAAVVSTDTTVEGSAAGARAQVRTLWQGNTLYVLFEVTDPAIDASNSDPWNRDSVELFLDLGNTKSGAYGPNDTQIRVTVDGDLSFGTGEAAAQLARVLASATALTDSGYVVELAIDLVGQSGGQDDVPLGGAGTLHGIDFQVNDGRDGSRYAVHTWAEPTGTGYQNTARWGVVRLVTAHDEEPTDPGDPAPTDPAPSEPAPTDPAPSEAAPTASGGPGGGLPVTGASPWGIALAALGLLATGLVLRARRGRRATT